MPQYLQRLDPEIENKIQRIRRDCNMRQLIRGLFFFGLVSASVTALFTLGLRSGIGGEWLRNLLILAYAALEIAAAWRWIWRPLSRPVSMEQVALLIDQQYPELENRIVSMVCLSDEARAGNDTWMIEKFLKESQIFVRKSSFGALYLPEIRVKWAWTIPLLLVACAGLLWYNRGLWVPSFTFTGTPKEHLFTVEPGSMRVRAGADQIIFVRSRVGGKAVTIRHRSGGEWLVEPMKLGESDQVYYYHFNNIREDVDYQVQFGSAKSSTFRLTVWVPPEVSSIDLTYHYPDYLHLPPRELPNSGDITAIEGSKVNLEAHVNKPLKKAVMVLESGRELPMEETPGLVWRLTYPVTGDDRYHLLLTDLDGEESLFNPSYEILAREDKAPAVKIDFPFRDMQVSALDEIAFSFHISDDFGLDSYGIQYQVAGRDAVRIPIANPQKLAIEAEGQHQLQLENLNLVAGDLLTWTIWGSDQKPDRDEYEELGDPFFLEVRPFARRFQNATSNQGAGNMQGGTDLVSKQKEVLIATWNLRKRLATIEEEAYLADRAVILETQEAVVEAVHRDLARTASGHPRWSDLIEALDRTLAGLKDAEMPAPAPNLANAAAAMQDAYSLLLKMEPPNTQVAQSQGNAGASSRNSASMSELEMNRNRNFYEDEKRTQQQQEAAAETLDKIKDLAQRQKMINQEIARLISEMESETADIETIKRRLEHLREEAKRTMEELDQIQREAGSGEMRQETSRATQQALDQARKEMNRSLENMEVDKLQQARAAGSKAVRDLDQLERDLESEARGSAAERLTGLKKKLEEIARLQSTIQEKVDSLGKEKDSPRLTATDPNHKTKTELLEAKDQLANKYQEMMKDAAEVANLTRGSQELLARKLGDWLRRTSREGIGEDIEETATMVRHGIWEELPEREEDIAQKLASAAEGLDQVAGGMAGDTLEAHEKALAELEQLLSQRPGQGEQRQAGTSGREEDRQGSGGQRRGEKEPDPNQTGGQGERQTRSAENAGRQGPGQAENGRNPGRGNPQNAPGNQPAVERQASNSGRGTGENRTGQRQGETRGQGESPNGQPGSPRGQAGSGGDNSGVPGRRGKDWTTSPEMKQFAETGYREWLDRLRNAEELLPEGDASASVAAVRREVENMRRRFRRDFLVPRYDFFLQAVDQPLHEVANQLRREIQALRKEREFILQDDGSVPDQYRKTVSDYFQLLSEAEGN